MVNNTIFELFSVIRFAVNDLKRGYFTRQELARAYIIDTNKSYYSFEKEFLYLIPAFGVLTKEKKNYIINWNKISEMYAQFPEEVESAFRLKEEKKSHLEKLLKERGVKM